MFFTNGDNYDEYNYNGVLFNHLGGGNFFRNRNEYNASILRCVELEHGVSFTINEMFSVSMMEEALREIREAVGAIFLKIQKFDIELSTSKLVKEKENVIA